MAKLRSLDGNIGVIPCTEQSKDYIALFEVKPGNAHQTLQEMREFNARRIWHVPARVCGGSGGQGRRGWQRRSPQFVRYIGPDGFRGLAKSISAAAVDAEEIADVVVGHVGHFGEAAFDAPVMPVINEAVFDAPVIT